VDLAKGISEKLKQLVGNNDHTGLLHSAIVNLEQSGVSLPAHTHSVEVETTGVHVAVNACVETFSCSTSPAFYGTVAAATQCSPVGRTRQWTPSPRSSDPPAAGFLLSFILKQFNIY